MPHSATDRFCIESLPGFKQVRKVCLDDATLVAMITRYTEEASFFKLDTFHLVGPGIGCKLVALVEILLVM